MAKNKPDTPAEGAELPVRKAFSLERVETGWEFVTISYKDKRIVEVERTEPDLKVLAIERFKIASFKYWSNLG